MLWLSKDCTSLDYHSDAGIFSRSVKPIPTGRGQIIPTYYYWPPQIFWPSGITEPIMYNINIVRQTNTITLQIAFSSRFNFFRASPKYTIIFAKKPETRVIAMILFKHGMSWRICKSFKASSGDHYGAKYLVFFSSCSLKTREKYISFAQLVLLSLYIFWGKCVYFSIFES